MRVRIRKQKQWRKSQQELRIEARTLALLTNCYVHMSSQAELKN